MYNVNTQIENKLFQLTFSSLLQHSFLLLLVTLDKQRILKSSHCGHQYLEWPQPLSWLTSCLFFPLFPHVETNFLHVFQKLNDYFYDDAVSLYYKPPTSNSVCGLPMCNNSQLYLSAMEEHSVNTIPLSKTV